MRKVALALIVLGVSAGWWAAALAQGTVPGVVPQTQGQWKTADQCGKDALAKYPDYTPEGNAQREAFRRTCLRNHQLAAPDAPLPQSYGAGH
jgi:hypothetical protein